MRIRLDRMSASVLELSGLEALIRTLREDGWEVHGSTVRDGAIVEDQVRSLADLPRGWRDEQSPGRYRLQRRDDEALFGHVVGPHSWKRLLFPPETVLWRARREEGRLRFEPTLVPPPPRAFLGVRACELAAIAIQDRVFLGGEHVDPVYAARRERVLLIAVQCAEAGGTCFCASMHTGPRAEAGFDLALSELLPAEGRPHRFLVEPGSERGAALLARLPHRPAGADEVAAARAQSDRAARSMGRTLPVAGLAQRLQAALEHPRWEEVAGRCLSCGNCALVCPTCFCSAVEDGTDLSGGAERRRRWDTCFSLDHSWLHGGSVRKTTAQRYRQWLTHKLSTWQDQFGTDGCVGCGRCITWCPVGIDLTEEARAVTAGGEA